MASRILKLCTSELANPSFLANLTPVSKDGHLGTNEYVYSIAYSFYIFMLILTVFKNIESVQKIEIS